MNLQYGVNSNSVKEMNRTLILRLIQKNEMCSRADLAKESGLRPATISNIVNDFIHLGLIEEQGMITGKKGRRSIGIKISNKEMVVLGVRITRTHVNIGTFDLLGNLIENELMHTEPMDGARITFDRIKKKVHDMVQQNSKIKAIGVAVPGPYLSNEGRITRLTGFEGWDTINIKEELHQAFDIPVIIDHDANAGALAELLSGDEEIFHGTTVYLAVGQGIGAGVLMNGSVFRGVQGVAGEIGHTSIDYNGLKCDCGSRGCLTLYATADNLVKKVREGLDVYTDTIVPENPTFDDVVNAIKCGDELACNELKRFCKYLAIGIINIIWFYNPDHIIIGDEIAKIGTALIDEIQNRIKGRLLDELIDQVSISLSDMEMDSAYIGAGALAIDYVLNNIKDMANI